MKNKVWNIPTPGPIPSELIQAGYPPLLAAILAARGVTDPGEAAAFLAGGAFTPADPMALSDMDAAVARIRRAMERHETVAVYGDYDVDGITAACLLTEYLRGTGLAAEIYIPDRLAEGYGLNTGAIDRLRARGVSLIITVDCGITAVEETEYARSLGMDMIITDHHECQAELPNAVAVVDPKRPDSVYPNRNLAGVGVAFKVACALSGDPATMLAKYAQLVAVGTVADVMPLVGENRQIVRIGLRQLRETPRAGLAALMEQSGVTENKIGAGTVGFTLAPRINAAGRLGRTAHAAALMMERDPAKARVLAAELCDMNRERQLLEADIWDDAVQMLSGRTVTGPIVLAKEGWHQGVIGIVASRLADTYQVPAIMISLDGGRGKGSCRSSSGFNLFDALAACGDQLESFGGHALAAGLNILPGQIDGFRAALNDYYVNHPPSGEEGLTIDLAIDSPELLSMECVGALTDLEPWGSGNPRPALCVLDAELTSVTAIGGGKHTRLRLEKFGRSYDCVWFSQQAGDLDVTLGQRVDAAFFPQVSEYRGRRSVQLVMLDLRAADLADQCRQIIFGGAPDGEHALDLAAMRALFRALAAQDPLRAGLAYLGSVVPRLSGPQTAWGLRVLREVSLCDIRPNGREIEIRLNPWEGKVDLGRSPTWREQHR